MLERVGRQMDALVSQFEDVREHTAFLKGIYASSGGVRKSLAFSASANTIVGQIETAQYRFSGPLTESFTGSSSPGVTRSASRAFVLFPGFAKVRARYALRGNGTNTTAQINIGAYEHKLSPSNGEGTFDKIVDIPVANLNAGALVISVSATSTHAALSAGYTLYNLDFLDSDEKILNRIVYPVAHTSAGNAVTIANGIDLATVQFKTPIPSSFSAWDMLTWVGLPRDGIQVDVVNAASGEVLMRDISTASYIGDVMTTDISLFVTLRRINGIAPIFSAIGYFYL